MQRLKAYWKRRNYQKLHGLEEEAWGPRCRRKNQHRVELGGGGQRRRRFWRIKVTPRIGVLRTAIFPGKFFAGIRDAYVRMMLRFANCGAIRGGGGAYGCGFVADLGAELARAPVKEYDQNMIVEIYKSFMSQGQLVSAGKNAAPAAQVVPRW